MMTTHRSGAQVTATITGHVQGGNLTSTLVLVVDGREYGLRLIDGVTITGDLQFGATVTAHITGTVISDGGATYEVLYNADWQATARIPHGLVAA
jgi:hypothetical protein